MSSITEPNRTISVQLGSITERSIGNAGLYLEYKVAQLEGRGFHEINLSAFWQ